MKSFVLRLRARSNCSIPMSNGYYVYSSLCAFTRGKTLDKVFHPREEGEKSLSISPLYYGDFQRTTGANDLEFRKNETGSLKISFLIDENGDEFAGMMESLAQKGVLMRIGRDALFSVDSVERPGQHRFALALSPESLLKNGNFSTVGFEFFSPCGFKRQGRQIFLPLPELIFGGLLRKWRFFFDSAAWPALDESLACMEILHYRTESRAVMMREDRVFRGFVGSVEFDANIGFCESKEAIGALAGLSFFTGVGYKTVQGMGHTVPYFRMRGD